ncbi:MAG: MFS transporter [Candidatus Kerfeldbacteria bacterium]
MNKKHFWGFAFYDFANTGYVLIMLSFLFPLFFKETIMEGARSSDFWWGLGISLSVTIAILLGPFFGHRSDIGNRKKIFSYFIALAVVGVILLGLLTEISVQVYFIVLLFTNIFFVLSQIIYDSFLPQIAPKENASIVSSFAWGFGYLGGLVCLALVIVAQGGSTDPSVVGIYVTAGFFVIFSIVSLKLLPSQIVSEQAITSLKEAWQEAKINNVLTLLIVVWFISGGIYIITFFGSLYARETLGVSIKELGIFLIGIQFIAFPATWIFGRMGKKFGVIKPLLVSVAIWIIIVLGIFVVQTKIQLVVVGVLGALVIGSTQSLLRAYYTQVSEAKHAGLDFGIYALASRSSAGIGPVLFGTLVVLTDSPRIAMLITIPAFFTGAYLLWKYNKKNSPS